jgi:uncharacterized protein YdbL (DUF1318 family)
MKRRFSLVAFFFVVVCLIYISCGPTVTIDPPDKPIEINVNVRIDIYNHVAAVEEDIYGDYLESKTEETPGGGTFLRNMFMRSAYGESDTEKYNAAKDRRKARAGRVVQYKKDGSIGENHKGLVSVIQSEKVKSDKSYADKVEDLVEDENADRNTMFEIDAAKRGVPVDILREETARFWRDNSKSGHWIEVKEDGKWVWKRK